MAELKQDTLSYHASKHIIFGLRLANARLVSGAAHVMVSRDALPSHFLPLSSPDVYPRKTSCIL
jgi:hypothetical protein